MNTSSEFKVPMQKITEEEVQGWIAEIESDSALSAEFSAFRERLAGAASLDDALAITKDLPGFNYDLTMEGMKGIAELFESKDTDLEDEELSDNELEAVAGGILPAVFIGVAAFQFLIGISANLIAESIDKEVKRADTRDRMRKMNYMATVEMNLLNAAGQLNANTAHEVALKAARGAETGRYR